MLLFFFFGYPIRGLDPGDGIEESCGSAVASVGRVDAFNVGVAASLKQLK
jgi:hypothetical protein